jgi:hypothetical protein
MGHNLVDQTKGQRDDAARLRAQALELHKAKLLANAETTKIYERLLVGGLCTEGFESLGVGACCLN